jgi:hypothetical protein
MYMFREEIRHSLIGNRLATILASYDIKSAPFGRSHDLPV